MGKKNTETAESEEKERGCIFLCTQLNVHDHVHLMKKASKEDIKKNKENKPEWKKERKISLHTVRGHLRLLFRAWRGTRCGLCSSVFMLSHAPYESCTPETSTHLSCFGKNQLSEEEPRQNQSVLSAPLCSANSWWNFQVAHKLAHYNSRLHRNYILLTACSFTCVPTVCVYNAWTRLEPTVCSSGLWLAGERALCLRVCSPECCVRSAVKENEYQEQSEGWLF